MEKQTVIKLICALLLVTVAVESFIFPDETTGYRPLFELGIGIQLGLIAFTYVCILTKNGNLLSGWAQWLERQYLLWHVKQDNKNPDGDSHLTRELAEHRWILKPVLTCSWCVGGWFGLLWFPFVSGPGWTLTGHVAVICMSITTSGLTEHLWNKYRITK